MDIDKDQLLELIDDVGSAQVIANIMVAPNLATTLNQTSKPLRTPEDGLRFHQLRKLAKAILIGGQTYRTEPYRNPPKPLYVSSKSLSEMTSPDLTISTDQPIDLIDSALKKHGAPILIEAGPKLLTQLMLTEKLEKLFISRVPHLGDGDFFDQALLENRYTKTKNQIVGESNFELWEMKKDKA